MKKKEGKSRLCIAILTLEASEQCQARISPTLSRLTVKHRGETVIPSAISVLDGRIKTRNSFQQTSVVFSLSLSQFIVDIFAHSYIVIISNFLP